MRMAAFTLNGKSYDVTREQVLDVLSQAIDLEIGENASVLVFKTAKLVYGIDYAAVLPEKFDLFQTYLEKTLGEAHCNRIIDSAVFEMKEYNRIDGKKRKVKDGGF